MMLQLGKSSNQNEKKKKKVDNAVFKYQRAKDIL